MFGNRWHFRELLTRSEEGIASNILAARLKRLVEAGLLSRSHDPARRQRGIYSLTEKAIQLVPVLLQQVAWGHRHLPFSPELAIRQLLMEEGGPPLWSAFADELTPAAPATAARHHGGIRQACAKTTKGIQKPSHNPPAPQKTQTLDMPGRARGIDPGLWIN